MTTDTFPYRFVATEGMYEGQTFVYLDRHTTISYQTDSPSFYHRVVHAGVPVGGGWWPTSRHEMTLERLAQFNSIPLPGRRCPMCDELITAPPQSWCQGKDNHEDDDE